MKNKSIIKIIIIVLIILLALSLIGIGIYLNNLSKPNTIFNSAIDRINTSFKTYFFDLDNHNIGDNFTIKSTITANLTTEGNINTPDEVKYVNLVKNLNNKTSNINLKQDTKNKKIELEVLRNFDTDSVQVKYLIDNSTEYYFVNQVLNNYVNKGSCNYFEVLNEDNTSKDNIIYLYDFMTNSLKNNLKDNYYDTYNSNDNLNITSIKLTDNRIREILRNMLSDLKNDPKANKILTSINEDFSKTKINDSTIFLGKNENYTINIYTSKLLHKHIKYEIIHLDSNYKKTYTYDISNNNITIIDNDKILYKIDTKFNNTGFDFNIKNSTDNNIGSLKYDKGEDKTNFTFSLNNNNEKYGIMYTSKDFDIKKDSYKNKKSIVLQAVKNKRTLINGSIEINSDISNDVKIDEDVSNAILEASLKKEEKDKIKERIKLVGKVLE